MIIENNYRYNFGGSTPFGGSQGSDRNDLVATSPAGFSSKGNGAFTIGNGLATGAMYWTRLTHSTQFARSQFPNLFGLDQKTTIVRRIC